MERVADRTSRTGQQSQLGSSEGAGQRWAFSRTQVNENHEGLTRKISAGRSTTIIRLTSFLFDSTRHRMRNDRPYLNRSPAGGGDTLCDGFGFFLVFGFNEIIAAELLLGFSEWPIGCHSLAVAYAHSRRLDDTVELIPSLIVAALGDAFAELCVFLHDRLLFGFSQLVPVAFVSVD